MIEWAKIRRVERIAKAADALTAQNVRWQRALQLDPKQFSKAQGLATGTPTLRVGLDTELIAAWRGFHRALAARVALRALPYVPESHRDSVTLHPWTEHVQLERARWGRTVSREIAEPELAAPLDPVVFSAAVADPLLGRDAWMTLVRAFERLRGAKEPQDTLLALALAANDEPWPAAWNKPELQPLRVLWRDARVAVWRRLLSPTPANHLLAEALTGDDPDLTLPVPIQARLDNEAKTWRERAIPPTRAADVWRDWIVELDEEMLDQAYLDALRDEAVGLLLGELAKGDRAVEPDAKDLWEVRGAVVAGSPIHDVLQKLLPEALQSWHNKEKELAGRFKGKARRQVGAQHLARMGALKMFLAWSSALVMQGRKVLEIESGDASELQNADARGALYAFTATTVAADITAAPPQVDLGHLFADMKGFTALTAWLKEVEIRQFLRQNFYTPLLAIAKDYYKGGHGTTDEGGIRLNNLLGDAISLSGDVGDLLEYAERALKLVQDELRPAIMSNIQEHGGNDAPAVDFDCGFFVAWGAAPIDLEFDDDVFGHVHVALAEKINESARGVARDGEVYDALRGFAAAHGDRPLAFRVHVGPKISGGWPSSLLDAWPTEPDEVDTLARSVPGAVAFGGSTGMYNTGIALSHQALKAYCDSRVRQPLRLWQGKTAVAFKALGERLLLPETRQTFVLLPGNEPRVVRRLGRVAMKGFKVPPTVWEWIGPQLEVFAPLSAFVAKAGVEAPWADTLRRLD